MKDKLYIEDLKSDYKIMTIICIHININEWLPTSIILAEIQKISKEINKLSVEFKNIYNEIPWSTIVHNGKGITTKEVEDKSDSFLKFKMLLEKYKITLNDLCYQKIKKSKPMLSTEYEHPIRATSSVKPVKK